MSTPAPSNVFSVSGTWNTTYPGAAIGLLVMHNVVNPERHAVLEQCKRRLEQELRTRFGGQDRATLKALPVIRAYDAYYKRYKKTYHVQLQIESIAHKGKDIPAVAGLVEAMFVSELKNQLLTAGHDLEAVRLPVVLDVATGTERYILYNGQQETLKAGDMFIRDALGVISSVLYGPDQRTRITPYTRHVLFTVYAPPGIAEEAVGQHLRDLQANVLLLAPEAATELLTVLTAE